jgi:hypothetical protein
MRGNLIKGIIALVGLAAIAGFTNPKQDAYNEYASGRFIDSAQKGICEKTGYCEDGEPPEIVKNNIIEPAIGAATKAQNYAIFSIYTTEFPGIKTFQTLGIFGNFFTYSEK